MRLVIFIITIVLLTTVALQALGQMKFENTGNGLSPKRLKSIDRVLEEYVNTKQIAGGVALIARNGKIGYLKSFGYKDVETQQPMTAETFFRIASMTKAVTVVAVMILFERGYFSLDDPLSKFIPEFSEMKVMVSDTIKKTYHLEESKRPITIRHLLNHTSGITYDFFGQEFIQELYIQNNIYSGLGATTGTLEDMILRLAKLPLVSHPGEKWQYGLNMDVLGYLVERISGASLDEFLVKQVFTPLRMTDTYFYLPDGKISQLASLYGIGESGQLRKIRGETRSRSISYSDYATHALNRKYFSGGAGLISTASDYNKFLQLFLNSENSILSRKTIELIMTEQTGDLFNWEKGFGFGFGFKISRGAGSTGNPDSKGAVSWLGIFNTHFVIDPEENLVLILLTQTLPNTSDINVKFKNLVYQAID